MTKALIPDVDLVIAFHATKKTSTTKQQAKEDAKKAEQQYKRLIETLTRAGLKAVGRKGEAPGHLLAFVTCPPKHVARLVKRERHSDFLSGLPVSPVARVVSLSPAERIRLVHAYISSSPADGGLGISNNAPEWDLVDSIFPLHDREFNELWIRAWKPQNIASVQLERIRDQFGDALAYYYDFLSSYTKFLVIPAILGLLAHFFLPPYSPIYSILLSIWAIVFVEWWRVHERILSLRFGTRGSFKVEKRRPQFKPGMAWWTKELRVIASIPVIVVFAGILTAILTLIFVFEAFVTELYEGPGKQIITFSPTVLFVALVPQLLSVYHAVAVRLTNWENHAHKSTYHASLTLKTFALSAIVAYMGLALSAFVYVPFGEKVMNWVEPWFFGGAQIGQGMLSGMIRDMLNGTVVNSVMLGTAAERPSSSSIWRAKLNPGRLRDQMFAYTVTNQVMDTFTEVGLPFLVRGFEAFRQKRKARKEAAKNANSSTLHPPASILGGTTVASTGSDNEGVPPKKKVVFKDEQDREGVSWRERAFLDVVRQQAALPEYDLFVDYNEMVVQFGYVVLWSTIWPLAGVMAFLNNLLEIRSDAFKMTVHNRRPVPSRTDTIGPWLDALTFLTWLAALTNSALVYLFSPQLLPSIISSSNNATLAVGSLVANISSIFNKSSSIAHKDPVLASANGCQCPAPHSIDATSSILSATKELLLKAVLISLVASHGFILVRLLIRHIIEKVFWKGSGEVEAREKEDREVKVQFLKGGTGAGNKGVKLVGEVRIEKEIGGEVVVDDSDSSEIDDEFLGDGEEKERKKENDTLDFWNFDEGVEEIKRISKEE